MFRLGWPSYLIHGTNKPYGVGMRSSHGCMRLYPEDIAVFFDLIPIGTKVTVVNQPYLFGWRDGTLYLQAYAVMEDDSRDWNKNRKRLLANLLNPNIAEDRHRRSMTRTSIGSAWAISRTRRARCPCRSPAASDGIDAVIDSSLLVENTLPDRFQLGRQDRLAGGREDLQRFGRRQGEAPPARPDSPASAPVSTAPLRAAGHSLTHDPHPGAV